MGTWHVGFVRSRTNTYQPIVTLWYNIPIAVGWLSEHSLHSNEHFCPVKHAIRKGEPPTTHRPRPNKASHPPAICQTRAATCQPLPGARSPRPTTSQVPLRKGTIQQTVLQLTCDVRISTCSYVLCSWASKAC